nr:IS110 family transposase [Methylocapsa aurea]
MPELRTLEGKQPASLAGLAPIQRQSGSWKGRAFIRGGRAFLRQALYMPALVACRFNKDSRTLYQKLVDAEKSPSPPSCASFSSSQTHSCEMSGSGPKMLLALNGYSSGRKIALSLTGMARRTDNLSRQTASGLPE